MKRNFIGILLISTLMGCSNPNLMLGSNSYGSEDGYGYGSTFESTQSLCTAIPASGFVSGTLQFDQNTKSVLFNIQYIPPAWFSSGNNPGYNYILFNKKNSKTGASQQAVFRISPDVVGQDFYYLYAQDVTYLKNNHGMNPYPKLLFSNMNGFDQLEIASPSLGTAITVVLPPVDTNSMSYRPCQ